eukprot:m.104798 g.104798  ORF g.104798 m.104798 type:complete len:377 (-) comp13858_c0_seq2:158-1288(-)
MEEQAPLACKFPDCDSSMLTFYGMAALQQHMNTAHNGQVVDMCPFKGCDGITKRGNKRVKHGQLGICPMFVEWEQQQSGQFVDEEEFEIDMILRERISPFTGGRSFLVKWKGVWDEQYTWVEENDMTNAPELLEAFNRLTPNEGPESPRLQKILDEEDDRVKRKKSKRKIVPPKKHQQNPVKRESMEIREEATTNISNNTHISTKPIKKFAEGQQLIFCYGEKWYKAQIAANILTDGKRPTICLNVEDGCVEPPLHLCDKAGRNQNGLLENEKSELQYKLKESDKERSVLAETLRDLLGFLCPPAFRLKPDQIHNMEDKDLANFDLEEFINVFETTLPLKEAMMMSAKKNAEAAPPPKVETQDESAPPKDTELGND